MNGRILLGIGLLLVSASGGASAQSPESDRYREACEGGDPEACNTLGLLYEAASGADRDVAMAGTLYERACAEGLLAGCTNLGILLQTGTGLRRDVGRAVELYRTACEGGDRTACDRIRAMERAGLLAPVGRVTVTGRVADAGTQRVLDQAIVTLPGLGLSAVSDRSGRFSMVSVPAGDHVLTVDRFGYGPRSLRFSTPDTPDVLLLLEEREVPDERAPGRVVGRVTVDGNGQGLADVDVSIRGRSSTRTLSNQQGRFTLRDVEPGFVEIDFEHLGYAARTTALILQPGSTVEVGATLATQAIELEPIQVTVRSSFLERNGFYDRVQRGTGTHFSRFDLDEIDPFQVSDVVVRVPGVRLVYGQDGNGAFPISRRSRSLGQAACAMAVFVDGVPSQDRDLNQFPPEWLEAMEIYNGLSAPSQYASECGVVLIWTRR